MTENIVDARRGRRQLLLIVAVFLTPFALAALLAVSGWVPKARSHGEPIVPQQNFGQLLVRIAGGGAWPWRASTPKFTLVALAGPDCSGSCLGKLDLLHRAQIGLTQSSDKLRLLYIGNVPGGSAAAAVMTAWTVGHTRAPQLLHYAPQKSDRVAVLLVAADGTAIVHYPSSVSVADINKDLRRLFR